MLLCIETSGKNCSVALFEGLQLVSIREVHTEQFSHSENLHVFIEQVLKESNLQPKVIKAIAISAGPGSYTGLRIGVATAKGLCYGWDIPLIALPTLRILAEQVTYEFTDIEYIIPMIDARRMEVFTAVYSHDFSPILGERAEILTESTFDTYLNKGKTIFLGDGITKFQAICKHKNAYFWENKFPSAKQMGRLALEKYQAQAFEDIAYFEPFYLKEVYLVKSEK
ncbi:tRNA threonylcarbamoyladenosine biosynthesis protein TsaB [Capnocytophaga granulosa]|uniref:tRNA threonylcarbamoyladenosine biosynthesis protein TsaB n=1 Tax=Capnocytophaga granulosa TaxID=45242 RepID=A0A1H2XB48_9FLAO|nr:tRNA (adenosine(37)-N6)-threonylcarbamoyltransferase complex dimerization subunit type 1 TsaB [Capnocytophaga granulosa]EPD27640.1 universal bacterial protein YeaZ [Capnocytophaga granulosa ATCC 51502]SDW90037.1 tRNA threonylcarbamoyladenosine biosynthesis protein TsaB [Capnocytophaga granulosa]SUX16974.1 UGMP family protein [Capnocytophaga granulosa]